MSRRYIFEEGPRARLIAETKQPVWCNAYYAPGIYGGEEKRYGGTWSRRDLAENACALARPVYRIRVIPKP